MCRGCGGQPLTSPRPFHQARDSADVHAAVLAIAAKFPEAPVFVVGFSLGAYTAHKYLGERDAGKYGPGALSSHALFAWPACGPMVCRARCPVCCGCAWDGQSLSGGLHVPYMQHAVGPVLANTSQIVHSCLHRRHILSDCFCLCRASCQRLCGAGQRV